jgi:hypothetical protein
MTRSNVCPSGSTTKFESKIGGSSKASDEEVVALGEEVTVVVAGEAGVDEGVSVVGAVLKI